MKRILTCILVCLLTVSLLAGCIVRRPIDIRPAPTEPAPSTEPTTEPTEPAEDYLTFSEMEYTRPDMDAIRDQAEVCMGIAETETDVDALMEQVNAFFDLFSAYQTSYALAQIYNSKNVTDDYWYEEYDFCMNNATEVEAARDDLLYALAKSPIVEELEVEEHFGEDFFDAYQGESIWDETYTELMQQEADLTSQYYEIVGNGASMNPYSPGYYQIYGTKLENVYLELVKVRQAIARHRGYDNYIDYAYDETYERDYTCAQAQVLMEGIRTQLVDTYLNMPGDVWNASGEMWTQQQTFDYLQSMAERMDGKVLEAFNTMKNQELYDIEISDNKYEASFEMFIWDYEVPYIFTNPSGTGNDPLTFTHEFGHFCKDYVTGGTEANIDVMEIFSQAMEYLSLSYADRGDELTRLKLAETVGVMVEQSMLASFEYKVYSLADRKLTAENIRKAYEEVFKDYGLYYTGFESRSYIHIPHYFIAPVYIISYVVSADVAFQYYQVELEEQGAGLALMETTLESEQNQILGFVEEAGLESPFAQGRGQDIRKTVEEWLS